MTLDGKRRFVISDIHGCSKTLKELIENKINLTKNDELYFLGDYIDRGPDSCGVIDYILELKEKKYNIFTLRGNHEQNILNADKEYDRDTFSYYVMKMNKSQHLLDENNNIKKKYYIFFNELTYFVELDDYFIVHAGFDFKNPDPFKNYVAMLEIRNPEADNNHLKNKKLIHGHQPVYLVEIQKAIIEKKQIIPLDNGCVYNKPHKIYDYTQLGNLCCLNLDTFELILQKNIDI
ncbi:MAG: serine/threonine protein phosphatase [Bacteroidales bacterium]|nr:serine/threonine protein phosphatase [Bacteroidales bacterium]